MLSVLNPYPPTAIARTDDQVARQHALSHAMGALFLESRVQDLEQSVERARRGHHYAQRNANGGNSRNLGSPKGGSVRLRQHKANYDGMGGSKSARTSPAASSILSDPSSSWHSSVKGKERGSSASTSASTSVATLEFARGIRIVDVSVLIYSLRSVHTWLRGGQLTLIVPYGALHTLDLLKTGKDTINHAARKALCFLEERLTEGSPFVSVSGDASASSSSGQRQQRRCRPGLFFQRAEEGWSDDEVDDLRTRMEAQEELEALISELGSSSKPAEGDVHSEEDEDDDIILVGGSKGSTAVAPLEPPEAPTETLQHGWRQLSAKGATPRHICEVLSCALWMRDEAQRIKFDGQESARKASEDMEQDVFALAAAYPPPALCDPYAHELEDLDVSSSSMVEIIHAITRSLSASSSGGIDRSQSPQRTHNGSTRSQSQGNGDRRHQQIGYASLADGLLMQRWALAFGFGSQRGGAKGAAGGAGATGVEVPLRVQILPTAASWLDLGGRREGESAIEAKASPKKAVGRSRQ
ncbi:hypothetical protein CF319_g3946 [Tilletia indica]|nr:hypothetical protein CF319_g3946 [Tilletia indica]